MELSKDAVAVTLARAHFSIEPGIRRVARVLATPQEESDPAQPIKLLEANEQTTPNGITPVFFGSNAAAGILYPSVIIEVTPGEYDRIVRGETRLPNGWRVGEEIQPAPEMANQ